MRHRGALRAVRRWPVARPVPSRDPAGRVVRPRRGGFPELVIELWETPPARPRLLKRGAETRFDPRPYFL